MGTCTSSLERTSGVYPQNWDVVIQEHRCLLVESMPLSDSRVDNKKSKCKLHGFVLILNILLMLHAPNIKMLKMRGIRYSTCPAAECEIKGP